MLLVCRFFADSSLTLRMTDADTAMYSRTHKYRPAPEIGPKRAQPQIKKHPAPEIRRNRARDVKDVKDVKNVKNVRDVRYVKDVKN